MGKNIKPESYTITAVIPVGQYANIQPAVTIKADTLEEAENALMPYIQTMFSKYGTVDLKPKDLSATLQNIKSFNESKETIQYDEVNHIYYYNGKRLTGASSVVYEYTKPFDSETISKACAKSWEIDQQDIKELWNSGGNISAGFGTAIHNALEHYFRFKDIGEKIHSKSKSKTENAALPKHPILKKIVLDLLKIDTEKGIDLPEVLISSIKTGHCGRADKLKITNTEKKICRVQDYKIIAGLTDKTEKLLTPFDYLPANKLSQYQIQLSVYANMLQLSGWQVDGLDIFAYEDGKWVHYKLDVLNIINK